MRHFTRLLAPVSLIIALCGAVVTTTGAQAATIKPTHHHTHVKVLFPTRQQVKHKSQSHAVQPSVMGSGNLNWNGGPVQHNPTTYVIFWGSGWQGSGTAAVIDSYFRDMGSTSFENILTQYYDGSGNVSNSESYAGAWYDSSTPPSDSSCGGSTIQDSSIQGEVDNAVAANGWPADGANAIYYVYTPNGYSVNNGSGSCSEQSFCAYHGYSGSGLAYAAMAYPLNLSSCGVPSSPNGDAAGDSLTNVTSHEQFEAITDPQVNQNTAWVDNSGYEIGDKCAWDFSAGYTGLNGGTFELQTEYSNASSSCVNSY